MIPAMIGPIESKFPRIGEYAFLSDSHTGALVAPDGSVEWLCVPRFDSPSVFAALLDRDAGRLRLGPAGMRVPIARRYEPGTNVVETTWTTGDGWLVVRDALCIREWREASGHEHARPPSTHDADGVLVRTAECIGGEVHLEMVCELAHEYGSRPARWELDGELMAVTRDEEPTLRLAADMQLAPDGSSIAASRRLSKGEACFCALGWSGADELPTNLREARSGLATTLEFWRDWLASGSFPDHPWRVFLQRSALALKGLTYAPTGAVLAAATTSLPETPGGERNWDYRFSWIRDSTFALWGLHTLGFEEEATDFMAFVAGICRAEGPEVQIMYGIGGEKQLPERELEHLSGYDGARPVRVGNAAHTQRQNDVYGALLDAVYIHSKNHEIDDELWEIVADQVEGAVRAWPHPDQGIWEARGEPKHYVSSKLMCWVALDRGCRLADQRGEAERSARWGEIADEIRAEILGRGVSDRGVFRQHYDTDALDASTLLVPLVRFLPPDDERVRATVIAIADELTEGGLVLRYRVEHTDDGMSGEEGTFTICSFWLVSALSEIGEPARARALCERLLALGGALRLYAEEIDAGTGRHLGNFPQAFTHLALINAVSHVIADELSPRRERAATAVFSEMRSLR
jgi:GH15 family glucan-1,4-alpha-glucosidase